MRKSSDSKEDEEMKSAERQTSTKRSSVNNSYRSDSRRRVNDISHMQLGN